MPECSYAETPLPVPAQAPKRSRLTLTATVPGAGEAVHPNTVIGIDVEYHVAEFEAGRYELVIHFDEFIPGSTKISGDRSGRPRFVAQAHGAAHLCAPIGAVFREETVRWPLQMHVSLQKWTGELSRTLYAQTQRIAFPSPDLSAKAQQRQKLAPSEDYYRSLDAIWNFQRENAAVYRACVDRFPEMVATLDVPYRQWTEKNAGLFAQVDALQLERHTEVTRGFTETPTERVDAMRAKFGTYLERLSDVSRRDRCADMPLIFTGEPREFVGRYLTSVNDYVASRPAPKAATK